MLWLKGFIYEPFFILLCTVKPFVFNFDFNFDFFELSQRFCLVLEFI